MDAENLASNGLRWYTEIGKMAIIINIDVGVGVNAEDERDRALREKVGITDGDISIFEKRAKARANPVYPHLEAICEALECQPRDVLEYKVKRLCSPLVTSMRCGQYSLGAQPGVSANA